MRLYFITYQIIADTTRMSDFSVSCLAVLFPETQSDNELIRMMTKQTECQFCLVPFLFFI